MILKHVIGVWRSPEYTAHKLQKSAGTSTTASYVEAPRNPMTLDVTQQYGCSFFDLNTWSNGEIGGAEHVIGVFHADHSSFTILELREDFEGGTTAIITGSHDGEVIHFSYAGTSADGLAGMVFNTDLVLVEAPSFD